MIRKTDAPGFLIAILLLLIFSTIGCGAPKPPKICTHTTTRCNQQVTEVCNSAGQWDEWIDCESIDARCELDEMDEATCNETKGGE